MTWIMLNPDELTATAEVLRQTASDLGELVGQVYAACCSCCAPPGVDASMAELGAWIRSCVGGVEGGLRLDAAGLDTSATVMANDASLVSATSAAWGGPAGVAGSAGTPLVDPTWGSTGSWLDGMDTPTTTVGGWTNLTGSWLDGIDTPGSTVGGWTNFTGSWTQGMDPQTSGAAWTEFSPRWDMTMHGGGTMTTNILGGLGGGGGMSVAGIGGSTFVPTMSQNLSSAGNLSVDTLAGNYVNDIVDGKFNGSHDSWKIIEGYDRNDPNLGNIG